MEQVPAALWVVFMLVLLALAFDFMNGFHDAANSIATVASTGVLKPLQALLFAVFLTLSPTSFLHLAWPPRLAKAL